MSPRKGTGRREPPPPTYEEVLPAVQAALALDTDAYPRGPTDGIEDPNELASIVYALTEGGMYLAHEDDDEDDDRPPGILYWTTADLAGNETNRRLLIAAAWIVSRHHWEPGPHVSLVEHEQHSYYGVAQGTPPGPALLASLKLHVLRDLFDELSDEARRVIADQLWHKIEEDTKPTRSRAKAAPDVDPDQLSMFG